jgi:ribosome-binding protein aMBF1 (putative translation factor)
MSPEQVRAARNWLAWTQAELADRAKVGLSTVKDYESGKRTPIANNLAALKAALEAGGMRFGEAMISGPVFDDAHKHPDTR